jgi:hypothetical protein
MPDISFKVCALHEAFHFIVGASLLLARLCVPARVNSIPLDQDLTEFRPRVMRESRSRPTLRLQAPDDGFDRGPFWTALTVPSGRRCQKQSDCGVRLTPEKDITEWYVPFGGSCTAASKRITSTSRRSSLVALQGILLIYKGQRER